MKSILRTLTRPMCRSPKRLLRRGGGHLEATRASAVPGSTLSSSFSSSSARSDSFHSSQLEITKSDTPKVKTAKEELVFGKTFTDHMLEIDWNVESGWGNPSIIPYGNMSLSPAASGLARQI